MRNIIKGVAVFAVIIILGYAYLRYQAQDSLVLENGITMEIGFKENPYAMLNGKPIELSTMHFVDQGVLMLPLGPWMRALGGAFGKNVNEGTFWVHYLGATIQGYLKSDYIFIENKKISLLRAPIEKDEEVFVSVDFFVSALGFTAKRNAETMVLNKALLVFTYPELNEQIRLVTHQSFDAFSKEQLKSVRTLRLEDAKIYNLDWLTHFENLEYLHLGSNLIKDIAPLVKLTKLSELDLSNNLISNLAPLATAKGLSKLNVSQNIIKDLAPLSTNLSLTWLDASKNRLGMNVLVLPPNLSYADFSHNGIYDLTQISGGIYLDTLKLSYNPILREPGKSQFPNLQTMELWGFTSPVHVSSEILSVREAARKIVSDLGLANLEKNQRMPVIYGHLKERYQLKDQTMGTSLDREASNPLRVLNQKEGNALGIAQLMQILLKMAGLEAYTYTGTYKVGEEIMDHAFNLVSEGSVFYYSDLTQEWLTGESDKKVNFQKIPISRFEKMYPSMAIPQFRFP
jgi:hypothetical protein